jgi:hypothetical protein
MNAEGLTFFAQKERVVIEADVKGKRFQAHLEPTGRFGWIVWLYDRPWPFGDQIGVQKYRWTQESAYRCALDRLESAGAFIDERYRRRDRMLSRIREAFGESV